MPTAYNLSILLVLDKREVPRCKPSCLSLHLNQLSSPNRECKKASLVNKADASASLGFEILHYTLTFEPGQLALPLSGPFSCSTI